MSFKKTLIFLLFAVITYYSNAQDTLSIQHGNLNITSVKSFRIPSIWIDSIDYDGVLIWINPAHIDTIINNIDNYEFIIIDNKSIYATILPCFSSLRVQLPTAYLGQCPDGHSFSPIKIHISHLPFSEQNNFIESLKKMEENNHF